MKENPTVVIVTACCSVSGGLMGIRLEKTSRRLWVADWAFVISKKVATSEGYGCTRVSGDFHFAEEFPGCPYCKAKSFVLCDCGTILCMADSSACVKCPGCGGFCTIGTSSVTSLSAGRNY